MSIQLSDAHKLCLDLQHQDLQTRLQRLSKLFLGTKYGPWKDGSSLEALDDFNHDLNTLDCVTFVEVVLALAKTPADPDPKIFKQQYENLLQLLHYANGVPNFVSRNHIHTTDWMQNNKFLFEDITDTLTPTTKTAEALIDKLTWMQRHKIAKDTTIPDHITKQMQPQICNIAYICTPEVLQEYSKFQVNFPDYGIVNIVRPNWDLKEKIGTHLNVSHLGLVFKDPASKELLFYHASTERLIVVCDTLYDYMYHFKNSPTIRGINVMTITPGYYAGK